MLYFKGEEVFNTYGEHSNADLLHMYGFVEVFGENIFETVEIPTKIFFETVESHSVDNRELLKKKFQSFYDLGLIDEDSSIVINFTGILNEFETIQLLQVKN